MRGFQYSQPQGMVELHTIVLTNKTIWYFNIFWKIYQNDTYIKQYDFQRIFPATHL